MLSVTLMLYQIYQSINQSINQAYKIVCFETAWDIVMAVNVM